jgi:hypothetical protein
MPVFAFERKAGAGGCLTRISHTPESKVFGKGAKTRGRMRPRGGVPGPEGTPVLGEGCARGPAAPGTPTHSFSPQVFADHSGNGGVTP